MLIIVLITLATFIITMLITSNGIERKEKSTIECELSKFCDVEKAKKCIQVKEITKNYFTLNGNLDSLMLEINNKEK